MTFSCGWSFELRFVCCAAKAEVRVVRAFVNQSPVPHTTPGNSLAFVDAKDWDSYRREQGLILAGVERMKERTAYYGVYNVSLVAQRSCDCLSKACPSRRDLHDARLIASITSPRPIDP